MVDFKFKKAVRMLGTEGKKEENMESRIINCILDEICKMTQIDPSWIEPDHNLQNDLELKPEEILSIGKVVVKRLNLPTGGVYSFVKASTPRELLTLIKSQSEDETLIKAA